MAKDKKSFVGYCDWRNTFDLLSDDEAGKLIKHFFAYVNDEDPVLDDRLLQMAFEPIKTQLKRDLSKYEEVKRKRAEAGRQGGLRSGENRTKQNEPNASIAKQNQANEADNVNDNGNDNGNVILLEKETKGEILKFPSTELPDVKAPEPPKAQRKKVAQKKESEKFFSKADFKKRLLELGVVENHADDWIQTRKDKRASFTESVIDGIQKECEKYGFSFPEAIKECAERSWQGFKYSWLDKQKDNGNQQRATRNR